MKSAIFKIIIGLIFLVMFNALFFLLGGTERTTADGVCYGFIHVAYLCLLSTPLFCNAGKGETVLSASLYLRALFYFFTELFIGVGFIWYQPESHLWPSIVQGVLLAAFLVLQLMSVLANDATKASLAKQKQERIYIRSLAENVKDSMRKVSDPTLRKQMAICYETLNSTSIESFPEAAAAELELESAVSALCDAADIDDDKQISQLIQNVQVALRHRSQAIRMARFS